MKEHDVVDVFNSENIAHRCKQTQVGNYRCFYGLCLHRFFAKIVGISKENSPRELCKSSASVGAIFCQHIGYLNIANIC